jgi:hypothetical protein
MIKPDAYQHLGKIIEAIQKEGFFIKFVVPLSSPLPLNHPHHLRCLLSLSSPSCSVISR